MRLSRFRDSRRISPDAPLFRTCNNPYVIGTNILNRTCPLVRMTMNENIDVHLSCNCSKRVQLANWNVRSEEHTSELQSLRHLVCRLLLEKKKHSTTNDCVGRQQLLHDH